MRIFSSRKRKAGGLLALALVAGVASAAVVHAAVTFGPNRPTFTWQVPATYVTFNSITNNPDPSIGDERYFIAARDVNSSDKVNYFKNVNVTDNQEVLVRVFFHNNAASNLGLIARNTKVRVNLPTDSATVVSPTAYISASNSNPAEVFSTMDFTNSQPFTLSYESGTAQLWTRTVTGGAISDSIVTSGAPIGTNGANGDVPGCAEFSGYVTFKVRVHVTPPPAPSPMYSCDALNVDVLSNRQVKASVAFSAKNGATFNGVDYNWGDGSAVQVVNTADAQTHTYAKDGTYTITARVMFHVDNDGQVLTDVTPVCTKQITISTPTVAPAVTTAPLPNTGAGDVIGLFTGVSGAAAAGHYLYNRRSRR